MNIPDLKIPRVVIVGCGFGGLQLAKSLRKARVQIVMFDTNNYHTFQPLLYQVATSGLEPDSIAYPIRKIFKKQKNFLFRWGKVENIIPEKNIVQTTVGELTYDYLVIATGTTTNYFGNADIAQHAMPMKSVIEAINLRSLILQNFEQALLTQSLKEQEALMTFTVVGGGPTGVELAGALCELKKHVLPNDYPELDFRKMRVLLIEGTNTVLQAMSKVNQHRALKYLDELGCEVWLETQVSSYNSEEVVFKNGKVLPSKNLIWAAGIK
ncbi:MAG TPA: FAD-dependent oxidoreductase, partial [Bacteroidia bacterium]|nr:FAD-dependent oxidoreductase [Bacteroidia bacterium]